jgi:hypothetical protein
MRLSGFVPYSSFLELKIEEINYLNNYPDLFRFVIPVFPHLGLTAFSFFIFLLNLRTNPTHYITHICPSSHLVLTLAALLFLGKKIII